MILHKLTGKAIARAVRAHFIANALLITSLLVEKTIIEPIAIALSLLM